MCVCMFVCVSSSLFVCLFVCVCVCVFVRACMTEGLPYVNCFGGTVLYVYIEYCI